MYDNKPPFSQLMMIIQEHPHPNSVGYYTRPKQFSGKYIFLYFESSMSLTLKKSYTVYFNILIVANTASLPYFGQPAPLPQAQQEVKYDNHIELYHKHL